MKWNVKSWMMSLHTLWKTSMINHGSSIITDFFSLLQKKRGAFHCIWEYALHGKMYQFHPRWTNSRKEWEWRIPTMSRLPGTRPVSGKQDSSRVDQREATCSPMDLGWNVHVGSRVRGSKWRIRSVIKFNVSVWQGEGLMSTCRC